MKLCPTTASGYLGIDCGGTRTVAVITDGAGRVLGRAETGPANLRLVSDVQLEARWREVAASFPFPRSIAIGMAGARTPHDRQRIRDTAGRVWPKTPCQVSHDLETALSAASLDHSAETAARIILISGTGSCAYGRSSRGHATKVGGWGHLLGDRGSGYDIGLAALRRVVADHDRKQRGSRLAAGLFRATQLNHPEDLVAWVQEATKGEIAALAPAVFAASAQGDRSATAVIRQAADALVEDALACMAQLAQRGERVEVALSGGVLLRQEKFARLVSRQLRTQWPDIRIRKLRHEPALGAAWIARQAMGDRNKPSSALTAPVPPPPNEARVVDLSSLKQSPTERRNPASMQLDRMSIRAAIRLMLREDARIPAALLRELSSLEKSIRLIAAALSNGGRLFYIGAGTSGRLGVLDASECPPTFRTPPEMVQGIMAGGRQALWASLEGAEDDPIAGASAIRARGVNHRDVVVGIAASGRTPFVWGALREAKRVRATTVLVCFNPHLKIDCADRPDVVIAPDVGPEVLTGSTRLKCGTATKLVLNLFTTLAMVQIGKVRSNLMVDLAPTNVKLKDRARRIVQDLTGCDASAALSALEQSDWVIQAALDRLAGRASVRGRRRSG